MTDETPNERGAVLTFVDDFKEWRWDHENTVTDISSRAVLQYLGELSGDCGFVIYPSDDGARVVLSGLGGDFQIEAELGGLLRDFATNDGWHPDEQAAFRRMLQDILNTPTR
jgi:hypothetical protein